MKEQKNKSVILTAVFQGTVPIDMNLDNIHAEAENYFAARMNFDIAFKATAEKSHFMFDCVTAEEKPSKKKETKRVRYNQKQAEKLLKRIETELAKYPDKKWAQDVTCVIAQASLELQEHFKNKAADTSGVIDDK